MLRDIFVENVTHARHLDSTNQTKTSDLFESLL